MRIIVQTHPCSEITQVYGDGKLVGYFEHDKVYVVGKSEPIGEATTRAEVIALIRKELEQ